MARKKSSPKTSKSLSPQQERELRLLVEKLAELWAREGVLERALKLLRLEDEKWSGLTKAVFEKNVLSPLGLTWAQLADMAYMKVVEEMGIPPLHLAAEVARELMESANTKEKIKGAELALRLAQHLEKVRSARSGAVVQTKVVKENTEYVAEDEYFQEVSPWEDEL